eukprot:COSAG02_NODE_26509_length_631_cov_1.041353_1_plen_30_part_01
MICIALPLLTLAQRYAYPSLHWRHSCWVSR